jgi:hypothetical protein
MAMLGFIPAYEAATLFHIAASLLMLHTHWPHVRSQPGLFT